MRARLEVHGMWEACESLWESPDRGAPVIHKRVRLEACEGHVRGLWAQEGHMRGYERPLTERVLEWYLWVRLEACEHLRGVRAGAATWEACEKPAEGLWEAMRGPRSCEGLQNTREQHRAPGCGSQFGDCLCYLDLEYFPFTVGFVWGDNIIVKQELIVLGTWGKRFSVGLSEQQELGHGKILN